MIENITEKKSGVRRDSRTMKFVTWGAIAGLIGGLGFGVVMLLTNMLPMVGMLVRQSNANTGFLVHMAISALFGVIFGAIMGLFTWRRPLVTYLVGFAYGLFWWVLGALVLMPILLGMPERVLIIEQMQYYSLVGHIIYGLTVSATINFLST
jgi:uncharacterized membrane protein YagU involved in acid resistance